MHDQTTLLREGQTLTITADAISSGTYYRHAASVGDQPNSPVAVAVSSTVTLGPFAQDRQYSIVSNNGRLSYSASVVDLTTPGAIDDFTGLAPNLSTIPAARSVTVSANEQLALFGSITITGTLTIGGEVRFGAWPF